MKCYTIQILLTTHTTQVVLTVSVKNTASDAREKKSRMIYFNLVRMTEQIFKAMRNKFPHQETNKQKQNKFNSKLEKTATKRVKNSVLT